MKKKLLAIFLVLTLCISFTACGSSDGGNDNNSSGDNSSSTDNLSGEFALEYENLHIYNDTYGDPHAVYIAELKNNSNVPVTINNATIDVLDKNGSVIITNDFISFYPYVIAPGKSAYICEEVANIYADEGLDFKKIDKAVLNYSTEEHSDSDSIDVEFSDLSIDNNDGMITVTGTIKNTSDETINEACVCIPIRDSSGHLQYFMFTPIESLESGETRDFEQTADCLDPDMDFSNSTINAFAYSSISEEN